jgi:hypothetical protein
MTFVGRRAERNALGELFTDVANGNGPRLALVGGEPGVGKTALILDAAEAAGDAALVLSGGCTDVALAPYQAFAEALGGQEFLPRETGAAPRGDAEADRYRFFGSVASRLSELAQDRPVVLLLDDLHWADLNTLELIHYLVRTDELKQLLILATYRDTDMLALGQRGAALRDLEAESGALAIRLVGWTPDDVLEYLGATVDEQLVNRDALARALVEESNGNPFFVGEMIRHLVELGATGVADSLIDLRAAGLPDSVREVVLARVGRTGQNTMRLLSMAAIIGPQFDAAFLAAAVNEPLDEVTSVLENAADALLLRRTEGPGWYRFAHALVHHTLYDELSGLRRSRLHERVAGALEDDGATSIGSRAGELAHHLLATHDPALVTRAATYARRAAEWSLEALAPDEAIRWYQAALDALAAAPADVRPEMARCLAGLGDAQRQAGRPEFRQTLLDAAHLAQEAGDREALVAAALANNRGFASQTGAADTERIAVLEAALAATDKGGADRARLSVLLALETSWTLDTTRRTTLADDGLRIARQIGDARVLAEVLQRRVMATWGPATLVERLAETAELEARARALDDPVTEFWACFYRTTASLEAADRAESERCLNRALALADDIGQPLLRWTMTVTRSWWALASGDIAEAEGLADEALQLGTALGQADAFPIYGTLLFGVRWQAGRLAELVRLLAAGLRATPDLPAYQASFALAALEAGQLDEARAALAAAASSGFVSPDLVWLVTMSMWAEVAARLDETSAAARLYDLLLPWSEQVIFSGAGIHGPVAHYLGLLAAALGRPEQAAAHFRAAADLSERAGTPLLQARTRAALNALEASR